MFQWQKRNEDKWKDFRDTVGNVTLLTYTLYYCNLNI